MLDRLDEIEARFEEIEADLQNPAFSSNPKELQRLGKARRELEQLVVEIRAYKKTLNDLEEASSLLGDPEMHDMAQAEVDQLKAAQVVHEETLKQMLLPKDPNDDKSVIIEIRGAAGGEESALFAMELFRMYTRYAERRRWKYEVVDIEETGIGGASYICFNIDANGAYSQLKHESGVHR
ncbi:MAG: PCRF domain-containing protein, partial [Armatimonadota bacterium]